MLTVYIFIALSFFSPQSFSDSSSNTLFSQGLKSFKSKNFTSSKENFEQLLKEHPDDPTLLFNIGLVAFEEKRLGEATAYWRKALYLKPGFSPAIQGLEQVEQLLSQDRDVSLLEDVYRRVPITISFTLCFLSFAILVFLTAHSSIRSKQGRPALLWQLALMSTLFILSASFAFIHYQRVFISTKATVLEESTNVYASPSKEAPSLLTFSEGVEVNVIRKEKNWTQVRKSSTEVGWVTNDKIFIHAGSAL